MLVALAIGAAALVFDGAVADQVPYGGTAMHEHADRRVCLRPVARRRQDGPAGRNHGPLLLRLHRMQR